MISYRDFRRPKDWEVHPLITPIAATKHLGLKNAGATAYMNVVLQQLYMLPAVRKAILNASDASDDTPQDSLLHSLQVLFAQLRYGSMQYVVPEGVWKSYRHQGQPINLREPSDAFECWKQIVDQLDSDLRALKAKQLVSPVFDGAFAVQKIIKVRKVRFVSTFTPF